jgi:hypothetical protein
MASGWPGKGHGALLKKSLPNRSMVPNQVQNPQKGGFRRLNGSQKGRERVFNVPAAILGSS